MISLKQSRIMMCSLDHFVSSLKCLTIIDGIVPIDGQSGVSGYIAILSGWSC